MMLSVLGKTQTTATIARYTYGRDLTQNICAGFGADVCIKTAYTCTPYSSVTASGSVGRPIQWSSEYNDTSLHGESSQNTFGSKGVQALM